MCVVTAVQPAAGYEIARTANEEQHELHWDRPLLPFSLVIHGQEDPEPTDLEHALVASFATWGEVSSAALQFWRDDAGAEPVSEPDTRNVLYWTEEGWEHDALVIALTSINYYPDTGQIADADIDFNGQEFVWTTSLETPRVDVQSIATHEIGHVLGLDHSEVQDSAMWWEYVIYPNGMGETRQRTLHVDDIEGITYLYPCEERKVVVGDGMLSSTGEHSCDEPFFAGPDYGTPSGPHTASCSAGEPARRGGLWIMGLLALVAWMRRRGSWLRPALVAGIAVLVVAASQFASHASVAGPTGFEDLASRADAAVVGRVIAVEPVLSESGHVHSLVELQVEQWVGRDGPASVLLERPSGELPDFGTYVPGDPRFEVDQEVLLVLADRLDGSPGILGMERGFFEVHSVDGTRTVLPPVPPDSTDGHHIPLGEAIREIRSALQ